MSLDNANHRKIIDVKNWKGKKHYEWFIKYPAHYYGITKKIKITNLIKYLENEKNNNNKNLFFITMLYFVTTALNNIEEMRLRVENNEVVLYDVVNPAYTVMTGDGVFDNCDSLYDKNYDKFYELAKIAIDKRNKHIDEDASYNDLSKFDQYYITSLPWIDFDSMIHPMPNDDSSYVPRICWGKYYQIDNEYYIDFNIQVSHALVDGYPLSLAFLEIEKYLNSPKKYIDESRENA